MVGMKCHLLLQVTIARIVSARLKGVLAFMSVMMPQWVQILIRSLRMISGSVSCNVMYKKELANSESLPCNMH